MSEIDIQKAYIPAKNVVARTIEDDLILVPIHSDTIDFEHALYSLTWTGKIIWNRLSPDVTVEELCRSLASEYDETYETILDDTRALLSDLMDKGLIDIA